MNWFFVGADLGQKRDHTAIAVIERVEGRGAFDRTVYAYPKTAELQLRYLERLPLGIPYTEMVRRIAAVTQDRRLAGRCHLAVDGTGVGGPVVDLLREARLEAVLMPVTITSGQRETAGQGYYGVPKRDLIHGLQTLMEQGGLKIADRLDYGPSLVEEMMAMEVKVSPSGNEQMAAWREGTHDDLVFAVALACWSARKAFPRPTRDHEKWWVNEHLADAERMFRNFKAQEGRMVGRW